MRVQCAWCEEEKAVQTTNTAFWELPDGTRSIEITDVPCVSCSACGISYQEEEVIEEIETQLLLIDTKILSVTTSYDELLKMPRLLKRNYFKF
ncbi:YokU family protein [Priestia megaterium]|nr:YokU family protein [Priestia megaterium]